MRAGCFRAALLSILIIASLMTPVMMLLSVGPASAEPDPQEYYFIIRGEEDCWNVNVEGVPPWKDYPSGSYPPLMVAKRVGDGAVVVAGIGRMCNGGPTYPTQRWTAGELDVLLDVAFKWMKPDNDAPIRVLWYGKYIGAKYEVYNDTEACAWLIENLRGKGYRVDSKWDPFTPTLLEPYDILVIPQIQAGDRAVGGDPDMIDDVEVDFIKTFVEGGGGLLLMDGTDATGYCFNAVQNKFLRALDFTYLFQHDAVTDPETGTGYEIRYITAEVTEDAFGADYRSVTGKTTITLYRVNSLAEPLENVEVRITPKYQSSMPGSTLTFSVMVTNTGKENDDYTLAVTDTAGWGPSLSEFEVLNVRGGKSEEVTLTITIPADATLGAEDTVTVTATSRTEAARMDSDNCIASAARRITPPIDDTYTHAGRPETNFGRLPSLYTGWYEHPSIGTGGPERAWLKFDLSVLPAGTTIDKAELRVYNYSYPEPPQWGSYGVIPYRVDDDDWSEGTMIWNNQPSYGAMLDDPKEVLETGEFSWDVTSFVQEEFGGDKKVSFCLIDIGEDTESNHSTWFASKEYDDYYKWAYLYIPLPYAVDVSIKPWIQDTSPGETLTYTVIITNVGTETDSYSLDVEDTRDWGVEIGQTQIANVPYGESRTTTLTVDIPSNASICTKDTITVTVTGTGVSGSDSCIAHAFEGVKPLPTDDAHASEGYPNDTYGDENTLDLQSYTRFYMNERIFLKFDLSEIEIPSGSTITEAEVWLWSRKAELTDINAQCWSVTDDTWSEDLVTWGTQPVHVDVLDTVALKYSPPSEDMWILWNVTEFVRNEFAGDETASFCIMAEVESASGRYRFNSKEWPMENERPHLKITYTTEIPPVGVDVSVSPDDRSGSPGATLTYTVTIVNEGDADDTYDLTVTDTWDATVSPTWLTIVAGGSDTATVSVTIPEGTADGTEDEITVRATSRTTSTVSDSATCTARAKTKEEGLPMTLIVIVVIVVVIVVVVALVLSRGRRAAPTWTS